MKGFVSILCIGVVLAIPLNRAAGQEAGESDWRTESQRDEIAPEAWKEKQVRFGDGHTLALGGGGRDHADGRWTRKVSVRPETFYEFRSHFSSRKVDEPGRSILARVLWQNERGEQIGPAEYPATVHEQKSGQWGLLRQVYRSPASAASAKLELHYRWDGDGVVYFEPASFEPSERPAPRLVRLATIHYRPERGKTADENMATFADLIADAAAQGADIVGLPEGMTLAGTGKTYVEVSEPVPGPTTRTLGEIARAHGIYIVAGLLERDGPVVYNTAVLIGRDGKLEGSYRKVSLPREESDGGVTPGDVYRTFDTDFGRVGILICWDVTFPEGARELAQDGAEVIMLPIWGGNTTLARARAIENQVYVVTSSYDMESGIFDHEGELVAQATDDQRVAVVEVDLNDHVDWPWLGDFKNRIPREMPPQRALYAGE